MINQSLPLLTAINAASETPLLTAVTRGHVSVASVLLKCFRDRQQIERGDLEARQAWTQRATLRHPQRTHLS